MMRTTVMVMMTRVCHTDSSRGRESWSNYFLSLSEQTLHNLSITLSMANSGLDTDSDTLKSLPGVMLRKTNSTCSQHQKRERAASEEFFIAVSEDRTTIFRAGVGREIFVRTEQDGGFSALSSQHLSPCVARHENACRATICVTRDMGVTQQNQK